MSTAAMRPPKTPRPWPVPRVASPEPAQVLADWAAGRPTPWQEPVTSSRSESTAVRYTFVTHAPGCSEVLLWANRLTDETNLDATLMEPVEGSDLWVATFEMPANWRASYCSLTCAAGEEAPWRASADQGWLRALLDRGAGDPRNPVTSTNRAGAAQAVVEGPEAPQRWQSSDLAASTAWDRHPLNHHPLDGVGGASGESDAGPVLLTPHGFIGDAMALLVVLDGEVWEETQGLLGTLERLMLTGAVRPTRVLLVPSGGRAVRWQTMGAGVEQFVEQLADTLLADVAPLVGGLGEVTVLGQSLGGVSALECVALRPDVFSWALSQSASTWMVDVPHLASRLLTGACGGVHLAHGAQEWVLAPGHEELAFLLQGGGEIAVGVSVHEGGHDYAWWRHAVIEALLWQEEVRRRR